MKAILILPLLLVVLLAGCSTRAWYEGMKSGHDNQCALAPVSEYEQCVGRHADSYDEYQVKRELAMHADGQQ